MATLDIITGGSGQVWKEELNEKTLTAEFAENAERNSVGSHRVNRELASQQAFLEYYRPLHLVHRLRET
jgi:hypothetical protein